MGMVGMSGVPLSLGEAEALVAKAAKGAGLPWGLAAEAGRAARRALAADRTDAPQVFADWLTGAPGGLDCPLKAGLYAVEANEGEEPDDPADALIFNAAADRLTDAGLRRAAIGDEAMATLSHLAHLTYAPATEESRAKGAG